MAYYGSAAGVAALAKTWTDNGSFIDPDVYGDGGTPTTLSEVLTWLEQVSVLMDIALSEQGFSVPVTHASVIKALGLKVEALVADLVHLSHGKGRLFSDRIQESGVAPQTILERELHAWVKGRINAFEAYGISRSVDLDSNQAYSIQPGRQP
jgi:hypothetical protein